LRSVVILALILGVFVGRAAAQDDGADAGQSEREALDASNTPRSTGEVRIELERFGLARSARSVGWCGLRVRLMDGAREPRSVIVRTELPDPDGDTCAMERVVTLNPGVWQGVWLYAMLSPTSGVPSLVSVYEAVEPGEGAARDAGGSAWGVGRLLSRESLAIPPTISSTESIIGVLGDALMGLSDYAMPLSSSERWRPVGGELSIVEAGLTPRDLPDRWMGLEQAEVLVWAGPADPAELGPERAGALREWIARGGHLVVVLPPVGQRWTDAQRNLLHDMLPAVTIRRRTGVDMNAYLPLLTSVGGVALPTNATVHELIPLANAREGAAQRVLSGPGGECVVARRVYGLGAVTLVGLDLTDAGLRAQGLPRSDVFWNRVLGRRGDHFSAAELMTAQNAQPGFAPSRRMERAPDAWIAAEIAKTGKAARGVLLGLIVFIVYWLVAGPGGYALLKRRGFGRHAWLGFAGAAGLFTVIAWGGASAIRPKQYEITHVTILDHVAGQPVQRARTWASALMPTYSDVTISIGREGGEQLDGVPLHQAIGVWSPAWESAGRRSFPDSRAYRVDAGDPSTLRLPSRSTAREFDMRWLGAPVWAMPRPVPPMGVEESAAEQPVLGLEGSGRGQLTGWLEHELPAPLTNITVIVVEGQRDLSVRSGRARPGTTSQIDMTSIAYVFRPPIETWSPGERIDMGVATRTDARVGLDQSRALSYLNRLASAGVSLDRGFGLDDSGPARGRTDEVLALTLFSQLPGFDAAAPPTSEQPLMRRADGHGLDLSRWVTTPCVIVVGEVDAAPLPTPVRVTSGGVGHELVSRGRTIVRWVYPLSDSPPGVRGEAPDAGEAGGT
jgi:hypothetical protein